MSRVEMEEFLRSAEVTGRKTLGVGVTGSERLRLSDGSVEHDAGNAAGLHLFKPRHESETGRTARRAQLNPLSVGAHWVVF